MTVIGKLTISDANVLTFFCVKLRVGVTAAYSVDLYALSVASLASQAGAALLILFYLRALLNINVVFSLNYSLTGLPTLPAFVYLPLFLSSTFALYLR